MATNIIRGSDGAIPQYDPNGLWKTWRYEEIYFGAEAINKFVPKVDDYVRSLADKKTYRVTAVDDLLIPTLIEESEDNGQSASTVLIGEGLQPVSFRLYLDTSKLPFEASLDSRHFIYGDANTYARIFRGYDVGINGKVISALFNGSIYLDDKVPLELTTYDNHTNLAQKCVPPFNTKDDMPNGEVCTVVIYNAQNAETSRKSLIVERSSFIRPVNAFQKYISSISLESVFLSSIDPYVLNYPLNVPATSLNVMGVLHYSDGSDKRVAIDGSKFSLFGIESFVATRPGQKVPLVLNYRLDDDEAAYGAISADGKKITEPYSIVTTHENGMFSPILMGYPRWDEATSTYVMRWWLMDLNRSTMLEATNAVQYNETSDVFDGNNHVHVQFLSIRVNLNAVSQALPNWIHTQTAYVKLYDPVGSNTDVGVWEIGQENVFGKFYGTGLNAEAIVINQNEYLINLGNTIPTLNEWLDKLYFNSKPVYSLYREASPPIPTHFTIMNDPLNTQTFPIDKWNQEFSIFTNITTASNLIVRWERHIANTTLMLAVTELSIKFVA
jgi:hypothetical protein